MKKVYLVTSGEYSDYGVEAVFTHRKLAEKYIEAFAENEWVERRIEVFELDPNEAQLKKGCKAYDVEMDIDGNVGRMDHAEHASRTGYVVTYWTNSQDETIANMCVFAKDKMHAIKIANELRTQLKAHNLWGDWKATRLYLRGR